MVLQKLSLHCLYFLSFDPFFYPKIQFFLFYFRFCRFFQICVQKNDRKNQNLNELHSIFEESNDDGIYKIHLL